MLPILLLIILCNFIISFSSPAQSLIDLNRATKEELEKLPGIGPKTAEKIVEYRQKVGGFTRFEDLLEVPGIGPKKLEAIKALVIVGAPSVQAQEPQSIENKSSLSLPARRPIYRYIDEQGIIHFTQFPEKIPPKYKRSLQQVK